VSKQSFYQLVGETDWKLNLKDFAISLEKEGKNFELRVQDYRYLRYSAWSGDAKRSEGFAPLTAEHAPELAALLDYALFFVERARDADYALRVNWEMYPRSILGWAKVWQKSELRRNEGKGDHHEEYQKLVKAISDYITKDMQGMIQALGFEPAGASMEKMSRIRADRLDYYKELLAPAGIPEDLRIPVPLMLSIAMQPSQQASVAAATYPISVDYLFATAETDSAVVYAAFRRALDEYEITVNVKTAEGGYIGILPASQPESFAMAGKLFAACLRATRGDEREEFFMRLNLSMYPEVYDEVVQRFNLSPGVTRKAALPRPELPQLRFHEYEPLPASGFQAAVNPFLGAHGYRFKHLQVSVKPGLEAAEHPAYERDFKPSGVEPDHKLLVPDVVYMVVEKK